LYEKNYNGTGSEELLLSSKEEKTPLSFSPDGKYLLFQSSSIKTKSDLWLLPLFGDRKPFVFLQTDDSETGGQISPDGKWLAYTSDESDRWEVYVTTFPGVTSKWQVSTGGGTQPRWRGDGKELFYLSADRKLMSVEIKSAAMFETSDVKPLFATRAKYTGTVSYDVTGDGLQFLINNVVSDETPTPLTVVLNWNSGYSP
jgi:Tol biopolymer transport system component